MKQSGIFTKARREAPADEVSKSAQLLIRAGFIKKEMAGVYDILPLGLRVLKNIESIIRTKMQSIGGQEIFMTALQDPEVWQKTNRWDEAQVDSWFKTKLQNDTELGLGFTHEEPLTNLMKEHLHSYKDLPVYPFQFQTKFRNELRAKSGIMRGREFLMKDLYSFSLNQKQHDEFYEKAKQAYTEIFKEVGLGDKTYLTFASGGSFAKYSHEFQTVTEAGEDVIYLDEAKNLAVNKEVYNEEVLNDLGLEKSSLKELKTVEVGNIFSLGTRFSDALELVVDDEKGEKVSVIMGSYGIGLGRLMGTIAEVYSDENGLIWPESVAPFKYHLINLLSEIKEATKIYQEISDKIGSTNDLVLFDDRDLSAGQKLAEADLIGIPNQIILGKNFLETKKLEVKNRQTGESQLISVKDFLKNLK